MRLPDRLSAIAEFIPRGSRLADIGTDHGYLPVFALENLHCKSVIATDIKYGPLQRAVRFAGSRRVGDSIEFRLSDGLEGVAPEECDTIVIAGMGGENILGILRRATWTSEGKHLLILQPMTRDEVLIRWLCENGYRVTGGRLVREGGRIRQVIRATGGHSEPLSAGHSYAGPWLFDGAEPLLDEYLSGLCEKLGHIAESLRMSGKAWDESRLRALEAALSELIKMREGFEYGKGF